MLFRSFQWENEESWTGSGNNDEERLTRLTAASAASLRRLLGGDIGSDTAPMEPDSLFQSAFGGLHEDLVRAICKRLEWKQPQTFSHLLAPIVAYFQLHEGHTWNDILEDHAKRSPQHATRMAALLRANPGQPLGIYGRSLLALCQTLSAGANPP